MCDGLRGALATRADGRVNHLNPMKVLSELDVARDEAEEQRSSTPMEVMDVGEEVMRREVGVTLVVFGSCLRGPPVGSGETLVFGFYGMFEGRGIACGAIIDERARDGFWRVVLSSRGCLGFGIGKVAASDV